MYKFYGDFIGQLDKNTQNQLSIVRDELSTERERQIKDANTIGEMMLKYPNSGIKFSDTVQQAIIKAQQEADTQKSQTSDQKAIQYNLVKQRVVQVAYSNGGKIEPKEYQGMRDELIAGGLGSYLDDFEKVASQYLSYEDKNKVGIQTEQQFLNTDYFRNIFTSEQLKKAAKEAGYTAGGFLGFGVGEQGINDYLNYLMTTISQYRKAGFSDEEILSLMKK
jgi:hypothetical protein